MPFTQKPITERESAQNQQLVILNPSSIISNPACYIQYQQTAKNKPIYRSFLQKRTVEAYKTFRPNRLNSNSRSPSKSLKRPNSSFVSTRNKSATLNITVKTAEDNALKVYSSLVNEKPAVQLSNRQKSITDQYNTRVDNLNNQSLHNNLVKIMNRENQYSFQGGNQTQRSGIRPQDSFKVRQIQLNRSRKVYLEKKEKEKLDKENNRLLNRLVKLSTKLTSQTNR